jgi:hypothetical protein
MEEKELTQKFREIFEAILPVIENAHKGFLTQKRLDLRWIPPL